MGLTTGDHVVHRLLELFAVELRKVQTGGRSSTCHNGRWSAHTYVGPRYHETHEIEFDVGPTSPQHFCVKIGTNVLFGSMYVTEDTSRQTDAAPPAPIPYCAALWGSVYCHQTARTVDSSPAMCYSMIKGRVLTNCRIFCNKVFRRRIRFHDDWQYMFRWQKCIFLEILALKVVIRCCVRPFLW